MDPISIDQAAAEFPVGKSTVKLWIQQGRLTRLERAVVAWEGVRRLRTMVDPAELARELARTNPRYLGSRTRDHAPPSAP